MADLIFALVLVLCVLIGLKRGFISSLVGVVSSVISFLLTAVLYRPMAVILKTSVIYDKVEEFVVGNFENNPMASVAVPTAVELIMNVISFVILIVFVKIIVSLIASFSKITKNLPVIRHADSLLGGFLGFISGILICYVAVGVIMALGANDTYPELAGAVRGSYLASELIPGNFIRAILMSVI